MTEWNSASSFQLSSGAGLNSISFTSDFNEYGSGVVGVTEVTFNTAGVIQKAAILLNDNYTFKSTPGFYGGTDIYLGDVVSHELGHLIGLSHSEVLDASMFYASYAGQSSLAYDDKAGARGKYGSGFGRISGYVKGGNHIPILGAHVQAISRNTGQLVSVFTNDQGRFEIRGLDLNDTFYLYTSPMKNPDVLPGYYANVQDNFCPGTYVGSFFQTCGSENNGFPQGITITSAQPSVDVGIVTINCSLKSNQDYSFEKLQPNFSPVTVYDYSADQRSEKGFVGHFLSSSSFTWSAWDKLTIDLRNFSSGSMHDQYLKLSLLGQKFGNQLEYELEVFQDGSGTSLEFLQKNTAIVPFEMDLTTYIPLSSNQSQNIFEVRLRARKLSSFYVAQIFPDFESFSTNKGLPYLLISSLYESPSPGFYVPVLDTASILSDNSSCLDAPLAYQVVRAKTPTADDTRKQTAAAAASCGTIEPPSSGGPGSGGWSLTLGFMLAALASAVMKRSKKFLS